MTVSDLTGLLLGLAPFLAMLLWCEVRDRRREQADVVRAEIHAATNHVLGGETMLSVQVEPARRWRRGRVHLSVPGGYESLIARVSRTVIERLPNRYELVIHRGSAKTQVRQRPKGERSMAKRILLVMRGGARADHALAARGAAALARKSGGTIRMVYITPMPRPRVDTHDRIVADTDREMARISADVLERLAALARELDDVPVQSMIRFGRLGTELSIEAEVFGADLIALSAKPRPGLRDRLRARYLARVTLGSRIPLVLLPQPAVGSNGQREDALALSLLH
jgi:nucleotide-binding universal stress UspA family protein